MGAAQSSNVAKVTTKAVSKIASEIIQNQKISTDQNQMINVSGGSGDVVIEGNHFNQKVNVNMKALLKALVQQKAQQDLATELAQSTKSVVSGLNFGQFSDASNNMETFMKASIDISTKVSQTCAANVGQTQSINVDNRDGNITIRDNTFDQLTEVFSKCVTDAVSGNSSIQKLQQKLNQSASAKSEGVSLWPIAAIIIAFFLTGGVVASKATKILKLLIPIVLFIIGIVLLVMYYTDTKSEMSGYGFSKLIKNIKDCKGVKQSNQPKKGEYQTAGEASDACKKDKDCKAVDWKGMDIKKDGSAIVLKSPETTFYNEVSDDPPCKNLVDHRDDLKILRMPTVIVSKDKPDIEKDKVKDGDIWVSSVDSKMKVYNKDKIQYDDSNKLSDKDGILVKDFDSSKNSIKFSSEIPGKVPTGKPDKKGDIILKYASSESPFFNIYKAKSSNGGLIWAEDEKLNVPGFTPSIPTSENDGNAINMTAYKKDVKKHPEFFFAGIGFLIIGIFSGVYISMSKNKDKK